MKYVPSFGVLLTTFLGYVAFICALLSTLIIYFTMTVSEAPAIFTSPAETTAWQGNSTTVIRHKREIIAIDTIPMNVSRSIDCVVGGVLHTFELPMTIYNLEHGESRMIPLIASFPITLPIGTKCEMRTNLSWSPTFSLKKFSKTLHSEEFLVGEAK